MMRASTGSKRNVCLTTSSKRLLTISLGYSRQRGVAARAASNSIGCHFSTPKGRWFHMGKKTVEFEAHRVVQQEKEISFTKKDGTPVDFEAKVPTKVPVHVKFKADTDKKR